MAVETRYFCNGTDQAVVTEKQYDQGLTACGNKSCSMYKHPFEKGLFCTTCERRIKEEEQAKHHH